MAAPAKSTDAALLELFANPEETVTVALQTLTKIAANIGANPRDEKFQRIKKSSVAVQKKVTDVPGGLACLQSLGFIEGTLDGEPAWCCVPRGNLDAERRIMDGRQKFEYALTHLSYALGQKFVEGEAMRQGAQPSGADAALRELTSRNSKDVAKCCLDAVGDFADKTFHNPRDERYKRYAHSNLRMRREVTDIPGGVACLQAVGFSESVHNGERVWAPKSGIDLDVKTKFAVAKESMLDTQVDEDKAKKNSGPGGIEGTIQDMLTSPARLNQILRNPLAKQMISSNPDVVEGFLSSMPEARETLKIYPEMQEQLERVMGRPLRLGDAASTTAATSGSMQPSTAQATVTPFTVQAYIYDVSQGMAKGMSQMLVGKQIDLVPHTGIVVFGKEYYFGSGPLVCDTPGKSVPVPVAQTMILGETSKTRDALEAHIRSVLAFEHTEQNYNLISHNCNHYANDVAKFLLDGKGLPEHIVNFGQDALSTPQGQQLRSMIEGMERNMRQGGGGSSMNPFGSTGTPSMPAVQPYQPGGGASGYASVQPPLPAAPASVPADANAGIAARLLEMGFPADKCNEAAAGSGGDFDLALALVMSTLD